ncbi:MAG: TatD family hydrolase [Mycoplasmataceae bacterium]|jgi:TatD DNase family protein|nr:TatD family hydrolase [Mycoplasmataceae bacterium]
MSFFDTHCHLNLEPLEDRIEQIIKETLDKQVFCNCVGVNLDSSLKAIKIAKNYPSNVICSVGIHPEYVDEISLIDKMEELIIKNGSVIKAIGECGLDYHSNKVDKQKQKKLFIMQIELAVKHRLPLVIHCRDAYQDLYDVLKNYHSKLTNILIHCFDTTFDWVNKFNEFNCYYAIGGKITYTDYIAKALFYMPLDKIVCETDAPFLSPAPNRKEVNVPNNVIIVVNKINEILNKNITEQIYKNSIKLFNIK